MDSAASNPGFLSSDEWTPPTVTWSVFLAALAVLANHDWSRPVEHSSLPGSPNEKSKLMRSMLALELTASDRMPTLQLRRLVREQSRAECLSELLARFYTEPWSWVLQGECPHQRLDAWLADHGAEPYQIGDARAFFKRAVNATGTRARFRRNPKRTAQQLPTSHRPQTSTRPDQQGTTVDGLERAYVERLIELASEKEGQGLPADHLWDRLERRLDFLRKQTDTA